MSQQLCFPVAYWDGPTPIHHITCMSLLPSSSSSPSFLITGSSSGESIHWDHEYHHTTHTVFIRPRAMLMARHKGMNAQSTDLTSTATMAASLSAITSVTHAEMDDDRVCIMASASGTISIWTVYGAYCISLIPSCLPYAANMMIHHVYTTHVHGTHHHHLLITSSQSSSLVHILYLHQRRHIRIIRILRHTRDQRIMYIGIHRIGSSDMLITVTHGGSISVWDMERVMQGHTTHTNTQTNNTSTTVLSSQRYGAPPSSASFAGAPTHVTPSTSHSLFDRVDTLDTATYVYPINTHVRNDVITSATSRVVNGVIYMCVTTSHAWMVASITINSSASISCQLMLPVQNIRGITKSLSSSALHVKKTSSTTSTHRSRPLVHSPITGCSLLAPSTSQPQRVILWTLTGEIVVYAIPALAPPTRPNKRSPSPAPPSSTSTSTSPTTATPTAIPAPRLLAMLFRDRHDRDRRVSVATLAPPIVLDDDSDFEPDDDHDEREEIITSIRDRWITTPTTQTHMISRHRIEPDCYVMVDDSHVYCGTTYGRIYIWNVTSLPTSTLDPSHPFHPLLPIQLAQVSDAFSSSHYLNGVNNPCTSNCMIHGNVTATNLARQPQIMLARGYKNGQLTLTRLFSRITSRSAAPSTHPSPAPSPAHAAIPSTVSTPTSATAPLITAPLPHLDLVGHTAEITCLIAIPAQPKSPSPNAPNASPLSTPVLVSGSGDATVRIWDSETGKLMGRFFTSSAVLSLHWHPLPSDLTDAEFVARGKMDGDLDPSPLLYPLSLGDLVFASCVDHSCYAYSLCQLHEPRPTHTAVQTWRGHDSAVCAVYRNTWCQQSDYVVTQTERGTVYIWGLTHGQLERCLQYETGEAVHFLTTRMGLTPTQLIPPTLPPLTSTPSTLVPVPASSSTLPTSIPIHRAISLDDYRDARKQIHAALSNAIDAATPSAHPQPHAHSHSHARSRSTTPPPPTLSTSHSLTSLPELVHSSSSSSSSIASLAEPLVITTTASSPPPTGTSSPTSSQTQTRSATPSPNPSPPLSRSQSPAPSPTSSSATKKSSTTSPATSASSSSNLYAPTSTSASSGTIARPIPISKSAQAAVTAAVASASASASHNGPAPILFTNNANKQTVTVVPFHHDQHLHLSVVVLNVTRLASELHTLNQTVAAGATSRAREAAIAAMIQAYDCILALLYDWSSSGTGMSHSLVQLAKTLEVVLTEQAHMQVPYPPRSFAVLSHRGQALSVLFPSMTSAHRRWAFDPQLTAQHALAITTVCTVMLKPSESGGACTTAVVPNPVYSHIANHYQVALPATLPTYMEAATRVLTTYALSTTDDVNRAARVLLQGLVERCTPDRRQALAEQWGAFYSYPIPAKAIFEEKENQSSGSTSSVAPGSGLSGTTQNTSKQAPSTTVSVTTKTTTIKHAQLATGALPVTGSSSTSTPTPPSAPTSTAGIGVPSDEELQTALLLSLIGIHELNIKKRVNSATKFKEQKKEKEKQKENGYEREDEKEEKEIIRTHSITEFEAKAQYVTHTLLRVLALCRSDVTFSSSNSGSSNAAESRDTVRVTLAAELLSQGLSLFRHHVTEPVPLIRRLYQLSLAKPASLATMCHRALLEAGRLAPSHFLTCMGHEALHPRNGVYVRQGAIKAITQLVMRYPNALAKVLPATVQMVTRCLDPTEPELRGTLVTQCTAALHQLVQKYPMVSFHQTTQRFAVGTTAAQQANIIIYDLHTATKWRILEGHKGDVAAVAFNSNGSVLVSYSAQELPPTLRVWNTGSSGLFGGLLGLTGKCTRVIKLDTIPTTSDTLLRHQQHAATAHAAHSAEIIKQQQERGQASGSFSFTFTSAQMAELKQTSDGNTTTPHPPHLKQPC